MTFGTLALIGLCGLCGPLLSVAGRGLVPVVVGEILAGVVIGRSWLHAVDPADPTLTFLSYIGFAMLMLSAGMNVPLRDSALLTSLGRGARAAVVVAILAVGAGLLVSLIGSVGHPAIYAVLIASGSAAVVLPVVQEVRLRGEATLTVIAQVTVADIAATVAIPFVLNPSAAGRVAAGTGIIAASVIAIYLIARWLGRAPRVHALRRQGKRRRWAIDLRVALIVLFTLAWIAQRTGASLLIAGFGAGLMIAAIGGPKRLSTEVLGVAGGFFIPLFFVLLGARIDLRGLIRDPVMIALALALVGLTVAVHSIGARLTRQPFAAGLLASAQLGVPSAIVALGLAAHVITATQGAAIIAAALISLAVCGTGAALLVRPAEPPGAESAPEPARPAQPQSETASPSQVT
jgi:Kef-type K+ transport system membrane component KefB